MIITDRFKSFSKATETEFWESALKEFGDLTEEEEILIQLVAQHGWDQIVDQFYNKVEYEREVVSVDQWIEDDFYLGKVGASIYKPWKDDLKELFESQIYDTAVIIGGIGCQDPATEIITDQGKKCLGDIGQSANYLSYDGKFKYMKGTHAFPKGKGMMYKVEHDDGQFVVSGNHYVLCADYVYRSVEQLIHKSCPIISSFSQSDSVLNGVSNIPQQCRHSYIRSIEKVKTDWYWDLHVPGTNNYCSGGAIHHNSGKSTFSHLATLRMIYEASCLKNPAESYGLAPNSTIGFCNLAKSKETARRVVFEGITSKIQESPYFRYVFPPIKDLKNEIIFPKNIHIIAGSSTDTSVIGMNIFGGIIDEGNFWVEAKKKTKAKMGDQKRWGNQTKAGRLFESVQRRMKSRYLSKGRLPGVLIVVSSKTTHDSFTEQLVKKHQSSGSNNCFVRDRSILEVKRDQFEKETFRVLVGNENYGSKILEPGENEEQYEGALILDIPVDLRSDFEESLDDSLRDIAGVSTMAISQFMSKPECIDKMIDKRINPFVCHFLGDPDQWDSRRPYKINWDLLCTRLDNGDWEPKINPGAKRHVHFDPAFTGDAFGLAIGHVAGTVPVRKFKGTDHEVEEDEPLFVIDFVLRIQGEPGEEVLFKNVRQLCYEFSGHGYHLAEFTMDTYQSREMVQALREQGFKASVFSVDTGISSNLEDGDSSKEKTIAGYGEDKRKQAYRYLRSAIYDGRVKVYDYPILFHELKGLEDGPEMIDHAENGSKDLADAVCGLVWTLYRADYYLTPVSPVKGISEVHDNDKMNAVDENFNQRPTVHGDIPVVKTVKKYKKRSPKTISPKYTKVSADGEVTDLRNYDADDYMARG